MKRRWKWLHCIMNWASVDGERHKIKILNRPIKTLNKKCLKIRPESGEYFQNKISTRKAQPFVTFQVEKLYNKQWKGENVVYVIH